MARQLYRVYLYVVTIALLVLAAVGLGVLLSSLLSFTPLRGAYQGAPTQRDFVQSLVFAITAWIIAAALGALHLRLIRRDIAEYPTAGRGAVRSFFLNISEGIAALVAALMGASGFMTLAYATQPFAAGSSAGPFAAAVAALLVVAALEVERRRFPAATSSALVMQRLHTFGVPLILLVVTALMYWSEAAQTSLTGLLIRANVYNPLDPNACDPLQAHEFCGPCNLPSAGYLWLAALVPIVAIALYAFMTRDDVRSTIRTITHIASLGLGVGMLAYGVDRGVEFLLRGAFGIPIGWSDIAHPWTASYAFVGPLSVGIVLVVGYGLWIRAEKVDLPLGAQLTRLTTEAVTSLIFAAAFWWGAGRLIYTVLQWFGAPGGEALAARWAGAIALTLAGLAYIPLAIHLRRATQPETSAPRRGVVLALLAGGIITGAVGLTITLYTLGTSLLGAPLNDWQQTVRAGLAALVVGLILVVSYGWIALQERSIGALFKRLRAATATPARTPAIETPQSLPDADQMAAIEATLKEFAAGGISLQEATSRIKALARGPRPGIPV